MPGDGIVEMLFQPTCRRFRPEPSGSCRRRTMVGRGSPFQITPRRAHSSISATPGGRLCSLRRVHPRPNPRRRLIGRAAGSAPAAIKEKPISALLDRSEFALSRSDIGICSLARPRGARVFLRPGGGGGSSIASGGSSGRGIGIGRGSSSTGGGAVGSRGSCGGVPAAGEGLLCRGRRDECSQSAGAFVTSRTEHIRCRALLLTLRHGRPDPADPHQLKALLAPYSQRG